MKSPVVSIQTREAFKNGYRDGFSADAHSYGQSFALGAGVYAAEALKEGSPVQDVAQKLIKSLSPLTDDLFGLEMAYFKQSVRTASGLDTQASEKVLSDFSVAIKDIESGIQTDATQSPAKMGRQSM